MFLEILNPTPVNLDSGFKLVVQGRRISFEFRVSAKKYSDIAENPFFVFGFRVQSPSEFQSTWKQEARTNI